MTPLGWLLLALALVVGVAPGRVPRRVGALVGGGRLTGVARGADGGVGGADGGVGGADGGVGARDGRSPVRGRRLLGPRASPIVAGAAAVGLAAGVVVGGVPLGLAGAAVGATAGVLLRDLAARRVTNARQAQLHGAVRVLVGELEAGTRPATALAAAAEVAPLHAPVFGAAAVAAGRAHDAGAVLAADSETRPIGLAWQLGEHAGAALGAVLARVAADLDAVDQQRRTVAVTLAGPRASAFLLAGLPLLGIGLGLAMGARPVQFLVGTGAGRVVFCVGALLDVAGVLWMRHILRRAERA